MQGTLPRDQLQTNITAHYYVKDLGKKSYTKGYILSYRIPVKSMKISTASGPTIVVSMQLAKWLGHWLKT